MRIEGDLTGLNHLEMRINSHATGTDLLKLPTIYKAYVSVLSFQGISTEDGLVCYSTFNLGS